MSIKMTNIINLVEKGDAGSTASAVTVLTIDASSAGSGRTRNALGAVGAAAGDAGAIVESLAIGADDAGSAEQAIAALEHADAIVLGSPVYRASSATPLKRLLDLVPRSTGPELDSPLAGKAVAIVHTGASLHHFLSLDPLRAVLAGFFAAHVVPPGLYVPREGFDHGQLIEPYVEHARHQGAALVELALLLRESTVLHSLRPQA
jgi:FMN reductase